MAPAALRHLRLIAVNIDGVLLNDTFSPVIHRFVIKNGGVYTAELERAVFSQPRLRAAAAIGVAGSPQEVAEAYFRERELYLQEHPIHPLDGAKRLLGRLHRLGVPLICYGGLERPHFDRHLAGYAHYFDQPQYVCTNDFRPGVREIATGMFGLRCDQVLFIDDVARVAETARTLGAAFIGHPSSYEHSFQEQLMREAGVRHLVRSLDEIDDSLLYTLDSEAADGLVWRDSRVRVPA
ncbi:HAD family phosphatase [Streptomyces sp. NPDC051001]|uniref:HAD family hydrolase n=1 Tax=Streptomyces sp. NPDC051001 TaxID=3155795 RepID=UPI00342CEB9B